jgi:spermidine synthase
VVCSFCEKHLDANQAAFKDSRLKLIIDDARAQLEQMADGSFDVIIGDLADPVFGGPCYQARCMLRIVRTALVQPLPDACPISKSNLPGS